MYKTIAFIVATLLVANTFAAPDANCLLQSNTNATCLLCKYNMVVVSGNQTCAAPADTTMACLHSGLVPDGINLIKVCELCPKGSRPTKAGACIVNPIGAVDASCGLAISNAAATGWDCLGCAESASAWNGFDGGKCVTDKVVGTTNVSAVSIQGVTTCPPGVKTLADAAATTCSEYGTSAAAVKYTTNKNVQDYDSNSTAYVANEPTHLRFYYSSDSTVQSDGKAFATTAIAGCWIADVAGTTCLKCRWGFIPTIDVHTAAPWGKVTCAAYTAPLLAARACVLGYKSGANSLCQTCVDKDGNLSAPSSTNNCTDIVASNNSSNNTSNPTTTTSSSILSLSFAAFLILIINRLF